MKSTIQLNFLLIEKNIFETNRLIRSRVTITLGKKIKLDDLKNNGKKKMLRKLL